MADIRSFFGGGAKTKTSDSKSVKKKEKKHDAEPSRKIREKENGEKKKKRIIIDSDSDEDPLPTKLRKNKANYSLSEEPIPPTPELKKEKHKKSAELSKPPHEKLNPITPMDFFGDAPVESTITQVKRKKERSPEREEPPSKKEKHSEKNESHIKKEKQSESNGHESMEKAKKKLEKFESKTKRKLEKYESKKHERKAEKDESQKKKEKKVENEHSPDKKASLAGKLSTKVKESSGFMNSMVADPSSEKVREKPKVKKVESSGPESKMKDSLNDYISQAKEKEKKAVSQKEKTEKTPSKSELSASKPPKTPKTPPPSNENQDGESMETPVEKKKKSYWAYKNREGPSALGTKSLPEADDNCLAGLTFVITGVLDAFDREEFTDYIKKYGGKVTSAVSGKTSFLIVGNEPGESKVTKAEKCGTKKIDEDSFIELVKGKSPKARKSSASGPSLMVQESPKKKKESSASTPSSKTPPPKVKTPDSTPSAKTLSIKIETPAADSESKPKKSYWAYKAREGPSALGSKSLPEAGENCLAGLTFVITGVLEAFEREEFQDYIQRYGGKVTGSVSGKTSYLIVGNEPGESKIAKAEKHNTTRLDEDGFIEFVKKKSPAVSASPKIKKESKSPKKQDAKAVLDRLKGVSSSSPSMSSIKKSPSIKSSPSISSNSSSKCSTPNTQSPTIRKDAGPSLLWVDKYKPKTMKQIVGQQGDKSNMNKLKKWLLNWKANNASGVKKNFHSGKDDGSIFKAALLSGPPGVGKTTTATLCCQELGFSFIEMNASDTRGKKALENEIKESLSNVTVNGMLEGKNDSGRNHVLIMDEVDGMAGNEDRGGMQELIQLIKKSQIPIICMCNDRNAQKIRSLANYTFDLRCYKPRVEQIKGFALSIAAKEGLKIPPQAIEQIVIGANQDIRQVLHNMQMWTSTDKSLNYDEAKAEAKNANKNIKIGNFDIVKTLFSRSDSAKMSINERIGLYFNDYSFVPLFMQENYPSVNPAQGSGNMRKTLELMSQAADSIADGNLVEKSVRSTNSWSLLPLHGLFSSVIPSMVMSGYIGQRIEFPKWLGKNSSRNKHDRILQELKTHMAISANCMKGDVNLDYLPLFKHRLTRPLLNTNMEPNDAAKEVIGLMDDYNLTREDWDSLLDISKWSGEPDVTSKIPTKVKSAFTRLYNKEVHKTPYAMHQAAKKSKGPNTTTDDVLVGDEETAADLKGEDEEDDKEDITKDAMIKMKKEKETKASSSKASSKATAKSKDSSKSKTSKSSSKGKKK